MRQVDQRQLGRGQYRQGQTSGVRQDPVAVGPVAAEEIAQVIATDDPRRLVEYADQIGKHLAENKMQTSQIRGIFGAVRRIEMSWPEKAVEQQRHGAMRELLLLQPKLAYQSARHKDRTPVIEYLEQVLRVAIDAVDREPAMGDGRQSASAAQVGSEAEWERRRARFGRFIDLFEAIIAYHRHHDGKD